MSLTKPHVLCLSHDYSLLLTRQWLLEKTDCIVLCAMSIPEFRERLDWTQVDLIVLCQTVTLKECTMAQELARIYAPQIPCLSMYVAHSDCNEEAGTTLLKTSEGPLEFMRAVRRLLPAQGMPPLPEVVWPPTAA